MDHPLWSKMVHLLVGLALTGCLGDQRQVDIQQSPAIGDQFLVDRHDVSPCVYTHRSTIDERSEEKKPG